MCLYVCVPVTIYVYMYVYIHAHLGFIIQFIALLPIPWFCSPSHNVDTVCLYIFLNIVTRDLYISSPFLSQKELRGTHKQ